MFISPFFTSSINAGVLAMVAGLVLVPFVSLITKVSDRELTDEIFACCNEKTIKKLFCLLAFSVVTFTALADDGGAWLNVQVNKGFKSAYAFARLEHRSYENFSKTEAFFVALGKHSVLDIFYLYHVPAGAEPVHTAGVGYSFNF